MFQTFKTRFKSHLMYFLWSILGKLLGFSVFLVLDKLTSISCHLRAIGSRLNASDECLKHSDYTRISLAFSYCFGIIHIVLGVRSLI